jgi:SanA protein
MHLLFNNITHIETYNILIFKLSFLPFPDEMSKKLIILFSSVALLVLGIIVGVNNLVNSETRNQIFFHLNEIPKNKVGLLLGTAKYQDKARQMINPYYQYRIDAAVELYMAGKVDYIIVSGDNSTVYYNEPLLMRNDLVARGVPESRIIMDNAGFRTLDSILRCRDIFGQTSFTIISQPFHNQRACFIANHKNVQAIAFCARDGDDYLAVTLREKMARLRMVLDLFKNTQAKYYGDKVDIP